MKVKFIICLVVVVVMACIAPRAANPPVEPTAEESLINDPPTPSPDTAIATPAEEAPQPDETDTSDETEPDASDETEPDASDKTEPEGDKTESDVAKPDLPVSSLFGMAWDDRTIYQAGLIEADRVVLADLPGASVYHLAVEISADLNRVSGREEVRYTNMEPVALDEVYFHLYPNLLGGSITISNLTVNGRAVQPDFSFNDSAMRVPLAEPLTPGQQVVIGMDFDSTVPETQERNYGIFASIGGVLALAHFYPLIAVYDRLEWDIEIPSPQGDVVYADTSFYLVRVTAPKDQVVVASGLSVDLKQGQVAQTITFAAGPMRDFYIASSSQYRMLSQTVGQTMVKSYFLPGREVGGAQALQYAVDSLHSFNRRYGTYPFVQFDIVPTANLALGIEYPGIVAINLLLYDPEQMFGETPASVYFESTVAHEVAHQWFYSLVGNDQLAEPWVDESLTQYATWRYYLDIHGQAGADDFREGLVRRMQRLENADSIPIGLPVSAYDPETPQYSAIVYGRGPLFFEALAQEMGQETLDQFLSDYAHSFRWGIADGQDMKLLAEQHCGCDLSALFAAWVYNSP